jgi:hypothetical protein
MWVNEWLEHPDRFVAWLLQLTVDLANDSH